MTVRSRSATATLRVTPTAVWSPLGRNLSIVIIDEEGNERSVNKLTYGSQLHVDEGDKVTRGQRLAEWDPVYPSGA